MLPSTVRTGWMVLACGLAYGQAAADGRGAGARVEFEAASVKPAAPQGNGRIMMGSRGGPGTPDPGRVIYTNLSLRDLITGAYGIKRSQLAGEPNWLDTARFDITATVPPGATKEQARVMMQNLLADRFKLSVHRESKEMAIYALVVGRNGPKLKESAVQAPDPAAAEPQNDPAATGPGAPPSLRAGVPPPPPMGGRGRPKMASDGCPETPPEMANRPTNVIMFMNGDACVAATQITMPDWVEQLSMLFDRPVVDMTGLKAKYDLRLRFDPSSVGSGRGGMMPMMMGPPPGAMAAGGGPGPGPGGAAVNGGAGPEPKSEAQEAAPDIFAAIQERLGLRLESRKAPADLLVIDHVEKTPTEN